MNLRCIAAWSTKVLLPALLVNLSLAIAPATAAAPAPGPALASGDDTYDPTRTAPAPDALKAAKPGTTAPTAVVPEIPLSTPSVSTRQRLELTPIRSNTNSFIWEVTSPTNTVYLFGTMHVGKRAFYPLPEAVETAFDKSAMRS